ncbi:DUF805 domain-containing protein [Pseudonocardia alaniniphila]|uniref:DUF805 domain-containing protein n=1 Tax=Pseudonocardia alaniniphila TaxID=75291 RepID=A0ABS9TEH8_9PSEU|nr:DUF805 domain-containing protein [Pseudonocardia alaniniphila]MCH6166927.1 DUF805 domain-containing protein [Pseudonocardia alaniniphila]
MQWYAKVLRQYADFNGRARRTEYWMFTLVSVIVGLVLRLIDEVVFVGPGLSTTGWLGLIYSVAVIVPTLAVGVRRLHDTGRSGWWLLIAVIPLIGAIVLIVFFALEGQRSSNAYGPDPKTVPVSTHAGSFTG